jgi:hypothetical protein
VRRDVCRAALTSCIAEITLNSTCPSAINRAPHVDLRAARSAPPALDRFTEY